MLGLVFTFSSLISKGSNSLSLQRFFRIHSELIYCSLNAIFSTWNVWDESFFRIVIALLAKSISGRCISHSFVHLLHYTLSGIVRVHGGRLCDSILFRTFEAAVLPVKRLCEWDIRLNSRNPFASPFVNWEKRNAIAGNRTRAWSVAGTYLTTWLLLLCLVSSCWGFEG